MNLQHHAAEVASICLSAGKELTIEIELKKITDVWREARFDIHNYTRGGTADRGLILKGQLPCTRTTAGEKVRVVLQRDKQETCLSRRKSGTD